MHPFWPGTLSVAATRVINAMDESDRQVVKGMKKDDLIEFHQDWGTSIRNEFSLGAGHRKLLLDCGVRNADEVSRVIIEAGWERLHEL